MRHKTVSAIAAPLCGAILLFPASPAAFAASVPPAQPKTAEPVSDEEQRAAAFSAMMGQLQTNLDELEIDIKGTVVDEDGKPVENVRLEIRYEKPVLPYMTDNKYEVERRVVSGDFEIKKKGFNDVELKFSNQEYFLESFHFHAGFGMGENEENTLKQPALRVVLEKRLPTAEISDLQREKLEYNLSRKRKTYCDLDGAVSGKNGNGQVKMVTIPLDEKPKAGKYLELDFQRDEHGEIVTREFPGVVDQKGESPKYPAVYIFRLHSDDPEDGMIVMEDGGYLKDHPFDGKPIADRQAYQKRSREENKIVDDEWKKLRPLERRFEAPKDGYTLKEVSIPVEELLLITGSGKSFSVHWRGGYRWMWFRCGNHYGKFSVMCGEAGTSSGVNLGALNDKLECFFYLELYLNLKPGDTNLRSFF